MAIGAPDFGVGAAPIQQAFSLIRQSNAEQRRPGAFDSMMETFLRLSNMQDEDPDVSELGPALDTDDPIMAALEGAELPFLSGKKTFFDRDL